MGCIVLVFLILIASFIASRARQMGYSSILWFFVTFLANPLIALGLLAGLPDRSIEKKRKEDMELLEKQLAQRGLLEKEKFSPIPRHTISDEVTLREDMVGNFDDIIYEVESNGGDAKKVINGDVYNSKNIKRDVKKTTIGKKIGVVLLVCIVVTFSGVGPIIYSNSNFRDTFLLNFYLNQGKIYRDQGDYNQAIAAYSRAIELAPQKSSIYVIRADLYAEQGVYDWAVVDYNKAILLNPNEEIPESDYLGQIITDSDKTLEQKPDNQSTFQVVTEGVDIVIALDISGSMAAEDFNPNRLGVAKNVITNFINNSQANHIGFVNFARVAFSQAPLTDDYARLRQAVRETQLSWDMGLDSGTAIGLGLATAIELLSASNARSKVIVLLTDGANNDGKIEPLTVAQTAREHNIRVYTIGVAKPGLVRLPFPDGRVEYRDFEIDEETLKKIADLTEGFYFKAEDTESLEQIYNKINEIENSRN